MPGRFLVDLFPWRMSHTYIIESRWYGTLAVKYIPAWFPGAEFQRIAQKGLQLSHDMRYIPYKNSRDKIVRASSAFRTSFLYSLKWSQVKWKRQSVVNVGPHRTIFDWRWQTRVDARGRWPDLSYYWNGIRWSARHSILFIFIPLMLYAGGSDTVRPRN